MILSKGKTRIITGQIKNKLRMTYKHFNKHAFTQSNLHACTKILHIVYIKTTN